MKGIVVITRTDDASSAQRVKVKQAVMKMLNALETYYFLWIDVIKFLG